MNGRNERMSKPFATGCHVIRPGNAYYGKQGFSYLNGISAETVGAQGLCMLFETIPPGARAKAHMHERHETAIYVLGGKSEMWYGERLENHLVVCAGEFLYIPAGVPHVPLNNTNAPVTAIIARTDPNEQQSVVLLPELDPLVPSPPSTKSGRGPT